MKKLMIAVLALALAAPAFAQMHGGMMGGDMDRPMKTVKMKKMHGMMTCPMEQAFYLGMENGEIEKMIQASADLKKRMIPFQREKMDVQKKLMKAKDDGDMKAVKKHMVRLAEIKADMMANHMAAIKQAKDMLSDEQLEKLGGANPPFFGEMHGPKKGGMMMEMEMEKEYEKDDHMMKMEKVDK